MIIFRYLAKEILITLFLATLVLLVLFITNQSAQFLQRAANGEIPATQVLELITLQVPLLTPYILPLSLYLGVLLTLCRMQLDSEMTVLYACGVSRAKITGMVCVVAFVVACVILWLMASIVPTAQGDINTIMNKAAMTASVGEVVPGRFMIFGKKDDPHPIVFYAKSVENHTILHHVFMAKKIVNTKNAADDTWDVITADNAYQSGQYLIFNQGYRYSGMPGEKNYHVLQFQQYGMRIKTHAISDLHASQYYSLVKLWTLYDTDKKIAAEFQWRLAMPIATLLFALLAVPLSEVRPRYGKFTSLFPAILIYVGYADLIFLTRAWMRGGKLSPALGMWWVHGLAILLVILCTLYRVGWYRIRACFARSRVV